MKRLFAPLAAVLAACLIASSAGATGASVVWTSKTYGAAGSPSRTYVYTAVVTSDSDDSSNAATGTVYMNGFIVSIDTKPGTSTPSASWGCQLLSPLGADALGNAIKSNRSATLSERAYPLDANGLSIFARADGMYTLSCGTSAYGAMGNSKTATVQITVQE